MYFNSREAAKSAGYFSRRHKSSEAHERSREGLKVRNFTSDVHRSKAASLLSLTQGSVRLSAQSASGLAWLSRSRNPGCAA